jgi:hypothetical protein
MADTTGLDEFVSDAKRIHETGANSLYIKCRTTVNIQFVLQQAGGTREYAIRCRGRNDDQIDIIRADAGCLHGIACSLFTQITGRLIVASNMPFLDTGTIGDPLVGGVDHLLKVGIG